MKLEDIINVNKGKVDLVSKGTSIRIDYDVIRSFMDDDNAVLVESSVNSVFTGKNGIHAYFGVTTKEYISIKSGKFVVTTAIGRVKSSNPCDIDVFF